MCDENLNKLIKLYFDAQGELADVLTKVSKYDDGDYKRFEKLLKDIKNKLEKINAKL